MKINKIFFAVLVACGALLSSCQKDVEPVNMASKDGLSVVMDEPEVVDVTCDGASHQAVFTRSGAHAENTTKIDNLTIWSYDASGNLAKTLYSTSTKGLSLYDVLGASWSTGKFTVLILGNMGDRTAVAPSTLAAARNFTFDVSDFKDPDKSFPLYGVHENVTASTVSLTVKRIISQYNFTFTQNPDNDNTYTINSMYLCNLCKNIRPFNEGYKATNKNETLNHENERDPLATDYFTGDEIALVNQGLHSPSHTSEPVSIYAFENMQGDLMKTTITSKEKKVISELPQDKKDLCTFFEANLAVAKKNSDTYYPSVYYRWLFGYGENMLTYNFDVPRNIIFNITVNFDEADLRVDDFQQAPEVTIQLVANAKDTIATGEVMGATADLYRNGEVIERGVNCSWSVAKGQNNIKCYSGAFVGTKEGDATIEAAYTYEGVVLKADKDVKVENNYTYFARCDDKSEWDEDARCWVDDVTSVFYVRFNDEIKAVTSGVEIKRVSDGTRVSRMSWYQPAMQAEVFYWCAGGPIQRTFPEITKETANVTQYMNDSYNWSFNIDGRDITVLGSKVNPSDMVYVDTFMKEGLNRYCKIGDNWVASGTTNAFYLRIGQAYPIQFYTNTSSGMTPVPGIVGNIRFAKGSGNVVGNTITVTSGPASIVFE